MARRRGVRDNDGTAYDARTGFEVLGRKLRQDGETGIWTTKPDPIHPQRFLRPPGPDGLGWRPGQGAMHAIGDTWRLGSGTWSPETVSFTSMPFVRVSGGMPEFSAPTPLLAPYENYALFCRFDGADGATTAVDGSRHAHTLSFQGNAQLDTAEKVFGPSSLLLDGSGDHIRIADSASWHFAAGEAFTMRAKAYVDPSATSTAPIIGRYNTTGDQRSFLLAIDSITLSTPRLAFVWSATGATASTISGPLGGFPLGQWVDVAVTREANSNNIRVFQDGALVGMTSNAINGMANFDTGVGIALGGFHSATSGNLFKGWIDQVEIIKGVCLWTADFTPPTEA